MQDSPDSTASNSSPEKQIEFDLADIVIEHTESEGGLIGELRVLLGQTAIL